jgi:hypothetical protein
MVIDCRVDFEIANNRTNNLVVGAISPVENVKLPLEDGKQLLNIAMLLGQALNDHGSAPQLTTVRYIPEAVSAFAADQIEIKNKLVPFSILQCSTPVFRRGLLA